MVLRVKNVSASWRVCKQYVFSCEPLPQNTESRMWISSIRIGSSLRLCVKQLCELGVVGSQIPTLWFLINIPFPRADEFLRNSLWCCYLRYQISRSIGPSLAMWWYQSECWDIFYILCELSKEPKVVHGCVCVGTLVQRRLLSPRCARSRGHTSRVRHRRKHRPVPTLSVVELERLEPRVAKTFQSLFNEFIRLLYCW